LSGDTCKRCKLFLRASTLPQKIDDRLALSLGLRSGCIAGVLLVHVAGHAQAGACDQLKTTLAARIDRSMRDFTLEVVPAGTPAPSGAKVIGTCEGGARKVLLLRQEGQRAAGAASAMDAAMAAPTAIQRQALAPTPTSTPIQAPAPAAPAPPPPGLPVVEAQPVLTGIDAQASTPESPPTEATEVGGPAANPSRLTAWLLRRWPWIGAALAMVLAVPLLSWLIYRRTYDSAGLPRGPRLG
jgi:hypothetical protein